MIFEKKRGGRGVGNERLGGWYKIHSGAKDEDEVLVGDCGGGD